jgi:hypothetical protein
MLANSERVTVDERVRRRCKIVRIEPHLRLIRDRARAPIK